MKTKIIEATNDGFNWGKFMLGEFDTERDHVGLDGFKFFTPRWSERHILVLDLETGEGAVFLIGGYAKADLDKHRIWVCPMFEPMLEWLYQQDVSDLDALPSRVNFTREQAPPAFAGYRRPGPTETG